MTEASLSEAPQIVEKPQISAKQQAMLGSDKMIPPTPFVYILLYTHFRPPHITFFHERLAQYSAPSSGVRLFR